MWLSLAERCVRDAEAAGSNPVTPIVQGLRGSPDKAGHKILGRGIFSVSGCYFTPGTLLFYIKITIYPYTATTITRIYRESPSNVCISRHTLAVGGTFRFLKDLLTKLYNKLYNSNIKTAQGYFIRKQVLWHNPEEWSSTRRWLWRR